MRHLHVDEEEKPDSLRGMLLDIFRGSHCYDDETGEIRKERLEEGLVRINNTILGKFRRVRDSWLDQIAYRRWMRRRRVQDERLALFLHTIIHGGLEDLARLTMT